MSLLKKEQFDTVFSPYKNKKVLLCLPQGNVGDKLINQGCIQLFSYYNISYDIINTNDFIRPNGQNLNKIKIEDAVFWSGGGNMGTLYLNNYLFRKKISQKCKIKNKPFIILPQTWTSKDDVEATSYYSREYLSIELYEPRALFCHDLALCYDLPSDIKNQIKSPTNNIGIFFRSDIEKTKDHPNNIGDPAKMCKTLKEYILLCSDYKEIHTNRLHFAIIGLILDRKVKLYSNSYYKNEAIYHSSLKQFNNIEFIKE